MRESSTAKHGGGSIMSLFIGRFWETDQGGGNKMDRAKHGAILENLFRSAITFALGIYTRAEVPLSKVHWTPEWFKTKKLNVLERPSQSPELDPVENLWWLLFTCSLSSVRKFTKNIRILMCKANRDVWQKACITWTCIQMWF